ncbi:hypothetical protein HJG60_010867 [Phyllostomus discolor]|uniref:Uncharacterized protein n=1 Tax=Phyllostomus discolor TaxID=89673 RepID=A0A834AC13_9CHIR|nr:hypothetical protein HJG60_010867 [Phyllostomus discolor]
MHLQAVVCCSWFHKPTAVLVHPYSFLGFLSLLVCHGWGGQPPHFIFHSLPSRVISLGDFQLLQGEMTVPYIVLSLFSAHSAQLVLSPVCIVVSAYISLLFLFLAAQRLHHTQIFCLQAWV